MIHDFTKSIGGKMKHIHMHKYIAIPHVRLSTDVCSQCTGRQRQYYGNNTILCVLMFWKRKPTKNQRKTTRESWYATNWNYIDSNNRKLVRSQLFQRACLYMCFFWLLCTRFRWSLLRLLLICCAIGLLLSHLKVFN